MAIVRLLRFAMLSGLLALMLSACSLAGYGYELAPWWLNRQVSSYVTFSASQQAMVDEDLAALHEWHRKTQLPVYVAFLEKVSDRWSAKGDRPNAQDLETWRNELVTAWRVLAKQLAPGLARVMVTLTPEQLDEIEAAVNERAKSQEEEAQTRRDATAKQRFQARVDRWVERGESFFGELTELQQARLAHRVRQAPEVSAWWLERSKHRAKLLKLIRDVATTKPATEIATEQVYQGLINYGRPTTDEMQAIYEQTRAASSDVTVELFSSASSEQVEHMQSKLDGYMSILRGVRGYAALSN